MKKNKLNILWTNDNIDTSEHMVMMYSIAAKEKGFFDDVTVIIWGATAKLVGTNTKIQESVKRAMAAGVEFKACIACATKLDVVDEINALGIELELMGAPLTNIIKEEEYLLTI